MTTTSPSQTSSQTMPHIIRSLEDAQPGDIASLPGGSVALKMGYTGTPWLLDPWRHQGKPERVTTYMLAQMGYHADREPLPHGLATDPTPDNAVRHMESLAAAGWSVAMMADAMGIRASNVRRIMARENIPTLPTIEKILTPHVDDPVEQARPSGAERLDDVEWLLDGGVEPDLASQRCGYASVRNAQSNARRAGRDSLADRLQVSPEDGDEFA